MLVLNCVSLYGSSDKVVTFGDFNILRFYSLEPKVVPFGCLSIFDKFLKLETVLTILFESPPPPLTTISGGFSDYNSDLNLSSSTDFYT